MCDNAPLISIIILNYNQIEVTCEFLDSTSGLTYPNYEIIMVDNASAEDPTSIIKRRFPQVHLVLNKCNLGFTGGNNAGIKLAKGDYVFIVNNDTEVTEDLLERLLEPFNSDPQVGIVSPKIKFYHHPETIQYAGFTEINPFTGRNRAIGNLEKDQGQHDIPKYTEYAHGAAMLVKREVIEKIGGLPEHFFIYYEELDYSAQAKRAGFKIYYQPHAVIYHKESITMGKESPMKAYYHNRNRILFMRRNTNKIQLFIFTLFLIFFIIPKSTFMYLSKGQITHLKNFGKALVWNLRAAKYA